MLAGIRERRIECGMTQTALAEALGVTPGAISQWESGLTRPTLDKLLRIAQILRCSVDELLQGEQTA